MMEAVSTSETQVNLYHTTGHNISEDSHLHEWVNRPVSINSWKRLPEKLIVAHSLL
jgi:hypothetical protein